MTGVGFVAAFSVFVGDIPEPSSTTWFTSVTVLGVTAILTVFIFGFQVMSTRDLDDNLGSVLTAWKPEY